MAVVALVLRIAYILAFHTYQFTPPRPGLGHWMFGYETGSIARAIAAGEGFSSPFLDLPTGPTAWIAPVYPYLCAGVFRLFGIFTAVSGFVILTINSIFSALTCVFIYLLGERTVGVKIGYWAGWLWAVVPLFMRWPATWVWEVSISAFLLTAAFLFALQLGRHSEWKWWAGFGFFWGIAALTNPGLLAFLPFSGLWPAYRLWHQGRPWFRPAVVASLVFFATLAPWLVRNRMVLGQWVFIRDNFGFEFHLGNYHLSNGMGWMGKHPTVNKDEFDNYVRMGEVAFVAARKDEAMDFVRQYPGEFLRLTLRRFAAFWDGTSLTYAHPSVEPWHPWMFWPLSALTALGAILAIVHRLPGAWLLLTGMLAYPIPYYLTYPQGRYRHPIEPVMLILSVYFCYEAVQYARARRPHSAAHTQEQEAVLARQA